MLGSFSVSSVEDRNVLGMTTDALKADQEKV